MENIVKPYLGWRDLCELFGCGRSKAYLLMHSVGVVYVGHAAFVRAVDLDAHLDKNGSIDIRWPRRKGARRV